MSTIKCIEKIDGGCRCIDEKGDLLETDFEERISFLRNIKLFSSLSDEQLEKVSDLVQDKCFSDGDFICHKGDEGVSSYIIFDGEVEVHKEIGADDLIYLAGKGEVIGEMAVLADIPRTASLIARGRVHLLEIHGENFVDLLKSNPEMSVKLLKILVRRLTV